jgi:hypothetical protein
MEYSKEQLPSITVDTEYGRKLIWEYNMTGKWNWDIPNEIHCGDILTTNEFGKILTVNGQEYVHVS